MMTSTEVLSAYMHKLGHPLKEIRERALQLLIAKLQLGWELEDELVGTRRLMEALLAWFDVQQPSLQEEALSLLLTVIKTKSGTYIAKEFGIKKLLSDLNNIKSKIDPTAEELFDDVLDTLRFLNTVQSAESLAVPRLNLESEPSIASDASSCSATDNLGPNFQTSNESSISSENIEVTNHNITKPPDGIRVLLFPWVDMSPSDSKTIQLIEDALRLVKSTRRCCRFVRDVFLRDFPAEIFLNRPVIIQSLLTIVGANNNGNMSEPLNVLLCITKALRTRLKQLSSLDLVHFNSQVTSSSSDKQASNDQLNLHLEELVSDCHLRFPSKEDGLESLRQLPAPLYALEASEAILAAMARSVVLVDGEHTEVIGVNDLNACTSLLESLVQLLLECVGESFWRMDHSNKTYRDIAHKSCVVMRHLGDLMEKYSESYNSDAGRLVHRITLLRLRSLAARLRRWARACAVPPPAVARQLRAALLDPALIYYPGLVQIIEADIQNEKVTTDKEFKTKYKELQKLFTAMEDAVTFMKNKQSCRASKTVLTLIKNSLPVLELHLDETYILDVGNILMKKLKHWDMNDSDWSEARAIALALMAHDSDYVQMKFYTMLEEMVMSVLVDDDGSQENNEKCLTLLCDVGVLTEICCHGLSSKIEAVSSSASHIMTLLLRGRLAVSDGCWWRLLASLLPVLPLLHAYAAHDTPLGEAICKSLEPEIAARMYVSNAEVCAGLVRALFVRCAAVRASSAHALCTLLDDPNYLPPTESLRGDVLLSALGRVQEQDFNVQFSKSPTKSPQTVGLIQVLDVLKQDLTLGGPLADPLASSPRREPTLEPSLRRATLQQLAAMMCNHDVHDVFVQCDGLEIVVTLLRISLLVEDFLAFPECAISCVSVLNSVCFASRHALAKVADLPALILRVVLIFPANDAAVQMSAQILSLVAWSGFALQELDAQRTRVVALPACVMQRTRLPFPVHSYWGSSPNARHSPVEWLCSSSPWRHSVRARWWLAWRPAPPRGPAPLLAGPRDLRALHAACPLRGGGAQLLQLQNATSHTQVNEALAVLEGYTHLLPSSSASPSEFASLPWRHTLSRFLCAPPASPRDVTLLTSLLKFLIAYMDNVPRDGDTMGWIQSSFFDTEASMISLLSREQLFPNQTAQDSIAVSQLHIHIVKVLLRCVVMMGGGGKMESLLKILLACLERVDLKNFHSLGYLNELTRCIRYTTNSSADISDDSLLDTLRLTTRTVQGSAAVGRKGQGCRLDAMLTLLAVLGRLQKAEIPVQRWGEYWCGDVVRAVVACGTSPRAELRAAALCVLAALARHAQILPQLTDAMPNESISEFAASVVSERHEASVVRAAAAKLLSAVAARTSSHSDVLEQDVLFHLRQNNFLQITLEILVEYCNNHGEYNNCLEPNIPLSLLERRSELEVRASKATLHISPSSLEPRPPPPTAGVVAALADLVHNLSGFKKCPVVEWNEQGLFRMLFRCASWSHDAPAHSTSVRAATSRACARAAAAHQCVRAALANTKDCLHNLMGTLTPLPEEDTSALYVPARTQALLLIATLLPERCAADSIWRQLKELHDTPFLRLLLQSLEIGDEELETAGLHCLAQLCQSTTRDSASDDSRIQFLDDVKSPYYDQTTTRERFCAGDGSEVDCQPEYLTEELCKDLVALYQKYSLDKCEYQATQDGNWTRVCASLSSLLAVSARARQFAVHRDVMRRLLAALQGVRDRLSVSGNTAELIRSADHNPVLLSLYWILTTMTCLMTQCSPAKKSLATLGAAASLLRLWPWCMMADNLRRATVELLCVFTNQCPESWSAVCTCVGGASLASSLCACACREAALQSRPRPARLLCQALTAALTALTHTVAHHHARAIILKSGVLSCIYKLRVSERTRGSGGHSAALAWSRLAEACARHADGAAALLQLRPVLAAPAVRARLMPALAHAASHHRLTFLQAPDLLELLAGTLLAGDTAEVVSAARAVWALAANNHRAKLSLRSAGVSAAVHKTMERLARGRRDAAAERALQLLVYTNTVLQGS